MAFTNFYLIAGGTGAADINAGSSIGAAQATPTTGGSWTNATNTFVATGGTPFGTTIVGDYVSIYADGATVTTYVAQVTTVVSNVSVILSATIKYGTAPVDGAANRSAVAGGSWKTEQVLAAGGLASTTIPQSTKINIKGNLSITASRTFSLLGTALLTLWFSGYNTTPGDLDNDTTNTLAKPIWTIASTFILSMTGNFQTWSSINIVGNRSGGIYSPSGANQIVIRCRSENTSANAAATAMTTASNPIQFAYCWFKTPTTATTSGTALLGSTNCSFIGCVFQGGGIAGLNCGTNAARVINCIGLSNTGAGFLSSTSIMNYIYSTIYGATVDGIKFTGTPGAGSNVIGCLFSGLNGSTATTNGINNASGANIENVLRACNDYYNVTNPEVGFGDSPDWFRQTDSNPVVISVTNITPVGGSNAINNGFPGIFENETFNGYNSIGAVDPQRTSGLFIN